MKMKSLIQKMSINNVCNDSKGHDSFQVKQFIFIYFLEDTGCLFEQLMKLL